MSIDNFNARLEELEKKVKKLSTKICLNSKSVLTPTQAAEVLQIDETKVLDMCENNAIPYAKIAGEYRIPRWLLDKWLNETYLRQNGML